MLWRAWRWPALRALVWGVVLAAAVTIGLIAAGHGLQRAGAAGSEPSLPNLVADPPTLPTHAEEPKGPFVTDVSTGTPRLLLRFTGYVHNTGPGALDFRASREKPKVSKKAEEEAEALAKNRSGQLSPQAEKEFAQPPMEVVQRLFFPSAEETNIERPHVDEHSKGEMVYANSDGHNHWHLQHVAKYSLWNAAKSAEVAPAQKVGFCLEDSQHVETGKGPSKEVYADNIPPFRAFCKQYQPGEYKSGPEGLFEGISAGWRDLYRFDLAWQWVDVSETPPGEYWLREEVNPTGVIKEAGEGEKSKFSSSPVIIPGFNAKVVEAAATGKAQLMTLKSESWEDSATPKYAIVTAPKHGTLGPWINGNQVWYTPNGSYMGPDSFNFTAKDPNSQFPRSPTVAAVVIQGETPSLAISGAQEAVIAGTGVSLSAVVGHDTGGVEWEATAGSVSPGAEGTTAVYHAPGEPGSVTVTAKLKDDPEVTAHVVIKVIPVPPPQPAPEVPNVDPRTGNSGSAGNAGYTVESKLGLSRPHAMWMGRYLVMTTTPTVAGTVRLTAYNGKHAVGSCTALSPAGRRLTCRLKPRASVSRRTRLSILASLRAGAKVYEIRLPAARIPEMKMNPAGKRAHGASAAGSTYWCSPSTLVPTLTGGEE
jgi:hypothetical protein